MAGHHSKARALQLWPFCPEERCGPRWQAPTQRCGAESQRKIGVLFLVSLVRYRWRWSRFVFSTCQRRDSVPKGHLWLRSEMLSGRYMLRATRVRVCFFFSFSPPFRFKVLPFFSFFFSLFVFLLRPLSTVRRAAYRSGCPMVGALKAL